MAAPVQLFVRPFGHPDGVAVSEEPEAERTARLEARFQEGVSGWRSSLTSQLASRGLEPEATEPLRRDPLYLASCYGPVTALDATDRWWSTEGGGARSHLVGFAVEDALVVAAIMAPEQAQELVEDLFMAMLEDFALNVLATRPPPNP